MKKLILLVLIALSFQFIITANAQMDILTIEIPDETLESVIYDEENYDQPTRLIFPNLTSVTGFVYFYHNVNLVSIEFPVLTQVGEEMYIDGNTDLELVNAPVLETVYNYLYVSGNSVLTELNVCNLSQILSNDEYDETLIQIPYYYIKNNTESVDEEPFCFSQGAPENITLSESVILENAAPGTTIGTLNAQSNFPDDVLTYYFIDDLTYEVFDLFDLIDNTLVSKATFDFEVQNEYEITIGVYNSLGEQTEETFTISIEDVANEGMQVIEILDETLEEIIYDQENFDQPTQLIFPNLTSVSGIIYFNQNVNLVSVDFPMLSNVEDYIYIEGNTTLESINAPELETIYNYLYVSNNSALTELNVCNLTQILSNEEYDEALIQIPYYYIKNNTESVDEEPFCFSQAAPQNLTLSGSTIVENSASGTTIGTLTAEGNSPDDALSYYLVEDGDNQTFELFDLVDNTLVSQTTFDFEVQNEYELTIGVYNSLGEQTEETFTISIEDVTDEGLQVIEILDEALEEIIYDRENFSQPTQLIFPNLTSVSGIVYFDNNVNLVSVEFPMLSYVGDYAYIEGNDVLESVNAPAIDTIHNYLYVSRNDVLTELNVCNLSHIISNEEYYEDPYLYSEPYYYIENNPVLDFSSTCLENTMFSFSELDTLMQMARIQVGSFEANTNKPMSYFIIEEDKELTENENFSIEANQLFLTKDLSEYDEDSYTMTIGALRMGNDQNTSLNQKMELAIEVNLANKGVSSTNTNTIAAQYPFLNQFVDFNNCNGINIEVYDFGHYAFALVETNAGVKMYSDFYDDVYCSGNYCGNSFNLSNPSQTFSCGNVATPTCNDGIQNGDETGVDCGGASCSTCETSGNVPAIFSAYPFLNQFADYNNCNGTKIEIYDFGHYAFTLIETAEGVKMYSDFYEGVYCVGNDCASRFNLNNPNQTWTCGSVNSPTCNDGIQNGDETGVDCGGTTCAVCEPGGNTPAIFTAYPFLKNWVDYTNCSANSIEVFNYGNYVFAIVETNSGINMYADFYEGGAYCTGSYCQLAYGLNNPDASWRCGEIAQKTQFSKTDLNPEFSMLLYPNPAQQKISVRLDDMHVANWKIVNPIGETLIDGTTLPNNKSIDISSCNNGLYFMMLFDETGKAHKQSFVVQQ